MTNYLISLGFWVVCGAAFLLYWRRRLDHEHRRWEADFNRRCAVDVTRWDATNTKDRAEHEALIAELDANADRVNQSLIARGLEPVPREPETTEPPEPQP